MEEQEEDKSDRTSMLLYSSLPSEIKEDEALVDPTQNPKRFVSSFVRRNISSNRRREVEKLISHKEVMMDTVKVKRLGKKRRKRTGKDGKTWRGASKGGGGPSRGGAAAIPQGRGKKRLSVREKKKLGLFDIPLEQQKYELYEPLHHLWLDYMRETLQTAQPNMSLMKARLLKCDLHGSVLTVTKSKCTSYVGISGILLQETKNVFKIITKDNILKTVPKSQCWFMFTVDQFAITIYGRQFCLRSSARSTKRFKPGASIDL